jgi:hypothetical protein
MEQRFPIHPTTAAVTPLRNETILSAEQLASVVGIGLGLLERLVDLGLVESTAPGTQEFTAASAQRLARMMRLHQDLEIGWVDSAIIVDLAEHEYEREFNLPLRRRPPAF